MNPYEVLGIDDINCTPAQIVRAYKQASKKAHPDREGGSEEQMSRVNQARDILLNPERRARYDRLGSTETGPATIEEQLTAIIGNLFESAISQLDDRDPNFRSKLFLAISGKIQEGHDTARKTQAEHPAAIQRAKKVLKSIDCHPLLKSVLEKKIELMEKDVLRLNQQVELGDRMVKLLQSIRFK